MSNPLDDVLKISGNFSVSNVPDVMRLSRKESKGVSVDKIRITTERPVRGGILVADGGDFSRYENNPVVLWNHAMSMSMCGNSFDRPIARTENLQVEKSSGIDAEFVWPKRGDDSDVDKIHNLWDARFIHAASIRFIPRAEETFTEKSEDGEVEKEL